MKSIVFGVFLALVMGLAPAQAQGAAGKPDKQAISKACSEQANAKGLHGKERKKFRSQCKRAGGKPM